MTRTKPISFLTAAAAVPLAALAVAGCGGDNDNNASGSTAPPAPTKTASGQAATVGVGKTSLGRILVDSQGRTLYLFQADTSTKSMCSGACAGQWPPLVRVAKPTVGSGANASMIGTSKRSGGARQVTYNGHPLYRFSGDQSAGDVNGQGINAFGALWYVVSPAGNQITASAPKSGGGGGGGGGY
jgi:predicted lipoprotein with Yx(FWY)xxD motif